MGLARSSSLIGGTVDDIFRDDLTAVGSRRIDSFYFVPVSPSYPPPLPPPPPPPLPSPPPPPLQLTRSGAAGQDFVRVSSASSLSPCAPAARCRAGVPSGGHVRACQPRSPSIHARASLTLREVFAICFHFVLTYSNWKRSRSASRRAWRLSLRVQTLSAAWRVPRSHRTDT